MEGQPLCISRRLQNLPPSVIVGPPPPPQRRRLDTDGSLEPVGVNEVPRELELRTNKVDKTVVEIEYLKAHEFVR